MQRIDRAVHAADPAAVHMPPGDHHHRGGYTGAATGRWGPGEQIYRVIPSDTPAADILQSHTSLGFDRVPIMRDLNIR
jgi:hypothetical protein